MTDQQLQDWLLKLAHDNANPNFNELLTGIAKWYATCATLSPKQLASVELSATKQGKQVPEQLRMSASAMPDAPVAPSDSAYSVLADLADTWAQALLHAAQRLRSLSGETSNPKGQN